MTHHNLPRVIALCGDAGSGKTTAADYLVEHYGYRRVKFADPLKNMLRAMGLTERQIEGDQKEIAQDALCGRSPRHLMQTLGTEWGRQLIGENLWINLWRERVNFLLSDGESVIVDDMRFINELDAATSVGAHVYRLRRPGQANKAGDHASEMGLAFAVLPVIINDGDLPSLYHSVIHRLFPVDPAMA